MLSYRDSYTSSSHTPPEHKKVDVVIQDSYTSSSHTPPEHKKVDVVIQGLIHLLLFILLLAVA
jgi:hypothetical protein